MTDAKTPRDVLAEVQHDAATHRGVWLDLFNAVKNSALQADDRNYIDHEIKALERLLDAVASYQITPVRADDGVRMDAIVGELDRIIELTGSDGNAAPALHRLRDLLKSPLTSTVAGAGRDAEARDAARYRYIRNQPHQVGRKPGWVGLDTLDAAIDAELAHSSKDTHYE